MTFFVDRDLGSKIFPGILREAGIQVEIHVDHFLPDSPDEEWLPEVAEKGWYVLSNDKGILSGEVQRSAVMRSGVGLFILVGGHVKAEEIAENFVNTFSKIEKFANEHDRPFIAKVYRPTPKELVYEGKTGRVELKLKK